jgi:hypothetical protein
MRVKARTKTAMKINMPLKKISLRLTLTVKTIRQDIFASNPTLSMMFLEIFEAKFLPGGNWKTLVNIVPSSVWWNLKKFVKLLKTGLGASHA